MLTLLGVMSTTFGVAVGRKRKKVSVN
ncbi:hypothetical protein FOB84_05870 [Gordonia bronchialis]|nr:hypothetical protein FOB84_05870 [Gordonia bronchialis]